MKKSGVPSSSFLFPLAGGWRVRAANGNEADFATLEEAAATLDPVVTLALPAREIMVERLILPSQDPVELEGMTRLQLEKTLPYPPEEITCNYGLIRHEGEAESVLLAAAVHDPAIDEYCRPLREAGRLPTVVTLFAAHVAAACPPGVALAIYPEHDQLMLIVSEDKKLSFLQLLSSHDPELLESELAWVILTAQMEGIPTEFQNVRVGDVSVELRAFIRRFFSAPVTLLDLGVVAREVPFNLAPSSWAAATRRQLNRSRLRQRLILAGVVYLMAVLLAIGYVVWLKQRAGALDRKLAEMRPKLEKQQAQQGKWEALAPAVVPQRSAVEILYQVLKDMPPGTKVTEFDYSPGQFMVAGESQTASEAIAYSNALKQSDGLTQFAIETGPPTLLKNDRAQFKIFGKL